jgi:type I restriction enzyme S subunit
MAGEWTALPLEECMAAIIDYRGKTPRKTSFGIPLVTAKVVKGGRIETPDEFVAERDYEAWMRRGLPQPGDVVVTTEAPLGEIAQLGSERVALAQRLIALRGKLDLLDNTFLKFLMQSVDVQDQLRARSTGTTVLGIKQSELRKVVLTLPPITEQRAVAHILGALDDKIELNRRMNETLEAIARALFKSWFVDFEPVRAKAEGRDPGLPQPLADLFPDSC